MREYHYAPMSGGLQVKVDGVDIVTKNWDEYHHLLREFLDLRSSGKIQIVEIVNRGHQLFHGRRGRVDIYREL